MAYGPSSLVDLVLRGRCRDSHIGPTPVLKKDVAGTFRFCPANTYLDLQNGENHGPYTAYTLYFGMLDHYFGLFWRSR